MKKLVGPLMNANAPENQAPADHYSGYPSAGPDPLEDQIARHLQYEITPKERPRAEPKNIRAQPQILVHCQRGEPDVHAVEIANEIKNKAERQ